jgi:CheY-like chemotaxis protein
VKEERSPQPSAQSVAGGRRRLRILIADDERDQVATLAALLQDEGHTVREVYRGTEVLRLIQDFDPDVALIDIGLPGIDGYEVARRVRAAGKPVRLVAITGYGLPEDRRRTAEAGFDVHLVKPVEMETLEQLLSRLEQPEPTSEAV